LQRLLLLQLEDQPHIELEIPEILGLTSRSQYPPSLSRAWGTISWKRLMTRVVLSVT